jgi:hypothetical protein
LHVPPSSGNPHARKNLFEAGTLSLASRGLRLSEGTDVPAAIIHAPSQAKTREKKRDPEMHSTKKGNQDYFGVKVHVGMDKESKQVREPRCHGSERAKKSGEIRPTWAKPKRSGRKPRTPWTISKREPRSTKNSPKKRKRKGISE